MRGYTAKKGNRYYAVIYEGVDPATGKERRRWYPAGARKGRRRQARHGAGQAPQRRGVPRSRQGHPWRVPDGAVATGTTEPAQGDDIPLLREQRPAPRSADARQGTAQQARPEGPRRALRPAARVRAPQQSAATDQG